jgi:hypothetical protein
MRGSNDSSQRSVEHNDNHDQATAASASAAAAVDLIRNLDKALLDMNAAARVAVGRRSAEILLSASAIVLTIISM